MNLKRQTIACTSCVPFINFNAEPRLQDIVTVYYTLHRDGIDILSVILSEVNYFFDLDPDFSCCLYNLFGFPCGEQMPAQNLA